MLQLTAVIAPALCQLFHAVVVKSNSHAHIGVTSFVLYNFHNVSLTSVLNVRRAVQHTH
jgi:hypothetical protein